MKSYLLILSTITALSLTACIEKKDNSKITSAECIDLTKRDIPSFISEVKGLSENEAWGRWSDADLGVVQFVFKNKLPQEFYLEIKAVPYGPNDGKSVLVLVGKTREQFGIDSDNPNALYKIKFTNVDSNTIEIQAPKPTSPYSLGKGMDKRRLGIGLISVKIVPI